MTDSPKKTPRSRMGRMLILLPFWTFIAYIIVAVTYSVFSNLYLNEPHDHANIAQRSWCHENLSYLNSHVGAQKVSAEVHQTLFPHREQLRYQKWVDKFKNYRAECEHFTDDLLLQEQIQNLTKLIQEKKSLGPKRL